MIEVEVRSQELLDDEFGEYVRLFSGTEFIVERRVIVVAGVQAITFENMPDTVVTHVEVLGSRVALDTPTRVRKGDTFRLILTVSVR